MEWYLDWAEKQQKWHCPTHLMTIHSKQDAAFVLPSLSSKQWLPGGEVCYTRYTPVLYSPACYTWSPSPALLRCYTRLYCLLCLRPVYATECYNISTATYISAFMSIKNWITHIYMDSFLQKVLCLCALYTYVVICRICALADLLYSTVSSAPLVVLALSGVNQKSIPAIILSIVAFGAAMSNFR